MCFIFFVRNQYASRPVYAYAHFNRKQDVRSLKHVPYSPGHTELYDCLNVINGGHFFNPDMQINNL